MTPHNLHLPPEEVTTGQLFILLQQIRTQQQIQSAELVRIGERLEKQECATRDIVSAWRAGGTVLNTVKVIGSLAIAITATWALFRGLWSRS